MKLGLAKARLGLVQMIREWQNLSIRQISTLFHPTHILCKFAQRLAIVLISANVVVFMKLQSRFGIKK